MQIRNLPNHWSSKDVGWKLGKLFNSCMNVTMLKNGSKESKILKLFVKVCLDKPLMRGTKIKLENGIHWVEFKYEQLSLFCFYCWLIRHQERSCTHKMHDATGGRQINEWQYGEWLRASIPPGGRRGVIGEKSQKIQLREKDTQARGELGGK